MCTDRQTAVIVIDTGFSAESIQAASRVIGVYDLRSGFKCVGEPSVSTEALALFAGDPADHGSVVLTRLAKLLPYTPFILVRAFRSDGGCVRTQWHDGRVSSDGWTEGYRWAVGLAKGLGLNSVANCSFGGSTHAVDGSGWEAFQLGQETGPGKPGHIVVAAAGAGDGAPHHASFDVTSGGEVTLVAAQDGDTVYNLWGPPVDGVCDWVLEVARDSWPCGWFQQGSSVPPNMWNNRQQFTFRVNGAGKVHIKVARARTSASSRIMRFECWKTEGSCSFLNHVDPVMVMEPAVFPHVLAVGMRDRVYSPTQCHPGAKPDVLVRGVDQVSFKTADVTAAVVRLLSTSAIDLDITAVRSLLGKYPDVNALLR